MKSQDKVPPALVKLAEIFGFLTRSKHERAIFGLQIEGTNCFENAQNYCSFTTKTTTTATTTTIKQQQ